MKTYTLNEITDSKILYDKTPPKFMFMLVFLTVLALGGFITWSYFSIRTYVVKGQGIVTTWDKCQVMSKVSGEVTAVYMSEGKKVEKGDLLLKVNPSESNLQIEQAQNQVAVLTKRIELLTRAEDEATKGTNNFDKNNPDEAEFYNRLLNSYTKRKEYTTDEKSLKSQGYTKEQIAEYIKSQETKSSEVYYSTILDFTNEKKQLELEKSKLESQKNALEKSSAEYILTAPTEGKLHLNSPINPGMVLQGGTLLASISGASEELLVETLLSATDRPRIKLDSEVSLAIGGLNQAEYGTLKGRVISIDEDATVDQEKGNIYFRARILPEKDFLSDKKGEKIKLTAGMVAEARVKYEKITYFKYFIEQLGIKL